MCIFMQLNHSIKLLIKLHILCYKSLCEEKTAPAFVEIFFHIINCYSKVKVAQIKFLSKFLNNYDNVCMYTYYIIHIMK